MVFRATTDKKLALETDGLYALELRGIDADSDNASFDNPDYVEQRYVSKPCEWTIASGKGREVRVQGGSHRSSRQQDRG